MSTCIYCETELSDRGSFCKACGRQSTCTNCNGLLDVDATFCVLCGTMVGEIVLQSSNNKIFGNTFELNETSESNGSKASRNIRLVCSNDAVANLGDFVERRIKAPQFGAASHTASFGQNKMKPLGSGIASEQEGLRDIGEEIESNADATSDTSELGILRQIFSKHDNTWKIYEIELNATGQGDYAKRVTFLLLFLNELSGEGKTTRDALNKILEDSTVYDGNYRTWLSHEASIVNEDDQLSLNAAGRRKAQEAIKDFLKPKSADQWLPGNTPRRPSARTSPAGSEGKGTSKATASPGQKNPPTKEIVKQWIALKLDVDGHKTFASSSELEKALLSLWAIRKATKDGIKATSSTQMEKFLFQAFEIKVFKRSLENALNKDTAKTLAVRVGGTTFQILPPGIKHIEAKFGI